MSLIEDINSLEDSTMIQWARGKDKPASLPWLAYISVTNLCNHKCAMCPRHRVMRPERGVMSMEMFVKIVDELPETISKIYLMKVGEPFMNPHLEDMARHLKRQRPDIHVSIHTNGGLASPDRLAALLPHVDSLGFSCSAVSREAHAAVHGARSWDAVMENLGHASRLIAELPWDERPHLFIDYVRQEANAHEEEGEVVAFFSERFPGLASVDMHWVYNWQGDIDQGNMQPDQFLGYEKYPTCVFPWGAITICHDGKVSYCFEEAREDVFLGDLSRQSFAEVWLGEPYAEFRRLMAAKDYTALQERGFNCHDCTFLWSPHSQSPRNLCGGYKPRESSKNTSWRINRLMEADPQKVAASAVDLFKQGEVHQPLALIEYLQATKQDAPYGDALDRLKGFCREVLGRYGQMAEWRSMLESQHTDLEQWRSLYHDLYKARQDAGK